MYADAYAGHNVVVEGYFVPDMMGSLSQGSSQISFAIVKYSQADYANNPQRAQETMMRPGAIAAQAHISMRDQIFALKPYQPVRVHGVASLIGIYPAITPTVQSASTLVLCVSSIQLR